MAAGPTFTDGFDHYDSVAYLEKKWRTVIDSGITFGPALKGAGNSVTLPSGSMVMIEALVAGSNTNSNPIGFYVSRDSASARTLFTVYNGSTLQCKVVWNADGTLGFYDTTNTLQATSTKRANALDTAYHIEMVMTNATTNSSGQVYINGLAAFSSSIAISNIITNAVVALGGTKTTADTGADFTFDHFWVKSTASQVGPSEILTIAPTGDGVTNNWTASTGTDRYAMVDEIPPDEADFVTAGSSGITQIFKFPVTYPTGYTPSGFAITMLGSITSGQAMTPRYQTTDGGADTTFSNTTSQDRGTPWTTGSTFEEGLLLNNPTLVGGFAFVGIRRTA